ncbi:pro-resilin-like [Oratosquilla oratoria]|uniref:pro-resilin-like n=1 Tax=Oratosquilla oratoria TaxID=337810 RepID=UPI003F76C7D5
MDPKVFVLFALVATAFGDHPPAGYSLPQPAPSPSYGAPQVPAKYDFDWAVNDAASNNDFGHQESRDGDFTQGSYYVLLPDGRTQRVTYNVDGDSGFVAEVTYEGEARPSYGPAPSPQPSYAPPPPSPAYGGN